jgi:hypothetical protein
MLAVVGHIAPSFRTIRRHRELVATGAGKKGWGREGNRKKKVRITYLESYPKIEPKDNPRSRGPQALSIPGAQSVARDVGELKFCRDSSGRGRLI